MLKYSNFIDLFKYKNIIDFIGFILKILKHFNFIDIKIEYTNIKILLTY